MYGPDNVDLIGMRAIRQTARSLRWLLLALPISAAALGQVSQAPPPTGACDLERVRTLASRYFQEHQLKEVRAAQGIVTLLLRSPDGTQSLAIALHAAGTQLSTTVMGEGIDDGELTRLTTPITSWWQDSELQGCLAACCTSAHEAGTDALSTKLRATVQALLAKDEDAAASASVRDVLSNLQSWMARRYPSNLPSPRLALIAGSAWIILALALAKAAFLMTDSLLRRLALAGLFLYAMALSWTFSSAGAGDLRLNLTGIWGSRELDSRWGSAPIALFRLLAMALGGIHDVHIVWTNRILSSLLPLLMYGILAALQVNRNAALVAAVIGASHPLLIAFSGDLGRQPTYLFAALGSIAGLVGFLRRGGVHLLLAFVLGTVLATTSRPEGAHVLVVALAALLMTPAAPARRALVGVTLLLSAALAFVYVRYVVEYGTDLASRSLSIVGDPSALLWTIVFDPDFTPLAWIMMWTVGLAIGFRQRAAWVAIVTVLGLHVAWTSTGLYDTFVGYDRQVASARYEAILLIPFVIGAALFVEALLKAKTWMKTTAVTVFLVLTAITFPRTYETLLAPFTVDYEYRFLEQQARTLPPGSRLYILQAKVNDIGFVDAPLVGSFVDSKIEFAVWDPTVCDGPVGATGTYLYVGSSCAEVVDTPGGYLGYLGPEYANWLRECAAVRARLLDSEMVGIDVPAHKMSWYDFKQSTVRLSLYRDPCRSPPPVEKKANMDWRRVPIA